MQYMLPDFTGLVSTVGSRFFGTRALSQGCTVCPCGPERDHVVMWRSPASAGSARYPVYVSRNGWDLLPRVVTVGNGGSRKALLLSVTAGPSFHFSTLCRLQWEIVLFVTLLPPQGVLHHMLEHRRQLPGSHSVSGKHLTKPAQSDHETSTDHCLQALHFHYYSAVVLFSIIKL